MESPNDMLTTFSLEVSSKSQQRAQQREIMSIHFLKKTSRKYRHILSAVGLLCNDKFEETSDEKVVNMSKLTKPYFKTVDR